MLQLEANLEQTLEKYPQQTFSHPEQLPPKTSCQPEWLHEHDDEGSIIDTGYRIGNELTWAHNNPLIDHVHSSLFALLHNDRYARSSRVGVNEARKQASR